MAADTSEILSNDLLDSFRKTNVNWFGEWFSNTKRSLLVCEYIINIIHFSESKVAADKRNVL